MENKDKPISDTEAGQSGEQSGTESEAGDPKDTRLRVELKRMQARLEAAKEEIAKHKSTQEEIEKKAKLGELEKQGQWTAAKSQLEDEIAKLKSEIGSVRKLSEAALTDQQVRYELARAGVSNELFIEGALAKYHGYSADEKVEPGDFVALLKADENHKAIFEPSRGATLPIKAAAPTGIAGAIRSQTEGDFRKALESDDAKIRAQARAMLWKQRVAGGKIIEIK